MVLISKRRLLYARGYEKAHKDCINVIFFLLLLH